MTEYEEYIKLYYERYGDSGPSISISALKHKANPEECGCYECQLIELREWKKENDYEYTRRSNIYSRHKSRSRY